MLMHGTGTEMSGWSCGEENIDRAGVIVRLPPSPMPNGFTSIRCVGVCLPSDLLLSLRCRKRVSPKVDVNM